MNKKLLFLLLALVLLLPNVAFGQSIVQMVNNVAGVVIGVAYGIIVILWIVTGILFLVALGDPGKLKTAKTALFAAIGGTLIVVLAGVAKDLIANAVLNGT